MRVMKLAMLGVLAGAIGCGSVDATSTHDGAGGGIEAAAGGAGGGGAGGMAAGAGGHEDGVIPAGTGGAGGAGGAAGMAAGGAGGAAGRPLGAGCTADAECASSVCTTTAGGQRTCCDHQSTVCSACVGGYQAPMPDGTACRVPTCDSTNTVATNYVCSTGACTGVVGCCMWSQCAVLGDPAKLASSAICGANGDDRGTMCAGECIKSPGQRGCQI